MARRNNPRSTDLQSDSPVSKVYSKALDRLTVGKVVECVNLSCEECEGSGLKSDGTPCVHTGVCYCGQCRNSRANAQTSFLYPF